jgi:hypothetical protein
MNMSLKNVSTASLGITYTTCHLLDRKQKLSHTEQATDYSLTLKFQTRTVQIHPPFNIPALPNWLAV